MFTDRQIQGQFLKELELFKSRTPKSRAYHDSAKDYWLRGVPSHWMVDWHSDYPLYIEKAEGITLTDLDGNEYSDFCLGDTGAMFGHSPPPIRDALKKQSERGLTTMLPSGDAARVGELLRDRFGMAAWQVTATASDANRAVIRWFRAITKRRKLLVFNRCYHGSVDETLVKMTPDGVRYISQLVGNEGIDPTDTVVVEFNDLPSLEEALRSNEIACLLAEPVMTNVGMVPPEPGFWEKARELTRKFGVPLISDETHCISSGPGGYFRAHNLEADAVVLGKPVAGGIPTGAYGISQEWKEKLHLILKDKSSSINGTTTTLAGSSIQLAMMRVVLENYFTPESFAPMIELGGEMERGLGSLFKNQGLDWQVVRVGARVEFICHDRMPRNGGEAAKIIHRPVDAVIHSHLMNRGVIITPFHNMMLMSPSTTKNDLERFLSAFDSCLESMKKI